MLDEYLKRDDVKNIINEIKTNERYFLKEKDIFKNHDFYVSNELALYVFYDALYKYKVVVDDIYLFDEFLDQLEKIYKKLDNFDNIRLGINKLICKMSIIKLGIKDINEDDARVDIITYVYDRYITNGYYFHGFNTSYEESIQDKGFIPEEYVNHYDSFKKLDRIFAKYNVINIINKDFESKKAYFTDDLVMSCYYSNYSPMFFYKLLSNEDYFGKLKKQDSYLIDNINPLISHLKRFMNNNLFSEEDKNYIIKLVSEEWELLHRKDKKISLLFVKRHILYSSESIRLDDCLNDKGDIYEIIDRILSPKQGNISCKKKIEEFEILNLDGYYDKKVVNYDLEITPEEEYYQYKEEEVNTEFMNVYGKVSLFLLFGSLFISLGVIISIFLVIRGL